MNPNRKLWNEGQQKLQRALSGTGDHQEAIALFQRQHAMVHSAAMSQAGLWSFEDEIWQDMTEEAIRRIPQKGEHSIVWIMWHIARVEDVTLNLLVAGCSQIIQQDNWLERLKAPIRHTGNAMNLDAVAALSAKVDIEALRAYRLAVGRRTREIVGQVRPDELKQKIESSRVQQIWVEEAVLEAASEIVDYWSKRSKAGLLLMPATRHNFLHLNEALRIKQTR